MTPVNQTLFLTPIMANTTRLWIHFAHMEVLKVVNVDTATSARMMSHALWKLS